MAKIIKRGNEENISWVLTNAGTLTISGSGDMPDWRDEKDWLYNRTLNPWYRNGLEKDIKKIVVEQGITSIGQGAFDGCDELKEAVLPEGITHIKQYAFYMCEKLTQINIPESVRHIGDDAFSYCALEEIELPDNLETLGASFFASSLKRLTIPGKIKVIEYAVFDLCERLEEINIPASVEMLEGNMDSCKNLKRINVAKENRFLSSEDGVLFNKDKTILISYPRNKGDREYHIPDTVKIVYRNAFYGSNNLVKAYVPESTEGKFYFMECHALEYIDVSEKNKYFASQDGVLFTKDKSMLIQYPCAKKGDYAIPDSVCSIDEFAFYYANRLTGLYLGDSVKELERIEGCGSLAEIRVSKKNETFEIKNGVLFNKIRNELICYPSMKRNKKYSVPEGTEKINSGALEWNSYIEVIVLPKSLVVVRAYDFKECSNLKSIRVHKDNPSLFSRGGVLFDRENDELIYYPQNRPGKSYTVESKSVGCWAFSNTKHLEHIKLDRVWHMALRSLDMCESVKKISAFGGRLLFRDGTLWNTERHDVLWDKDGDMRKQWCIWAADHTKPYELDDAEYSLSSDGVLTISSKHPSLVPECYVERISRHDRNVREKIRKVVISDNICGISAYAFEGCKKLTEAEIQSDISHVGDNAFENCSSLKKINLPKLVLISKNAFRGCASLEEVTIRRGQEYCKIDDMAFSGCRSLRSIQLPETIEHIGFLAFANCKSLKEINIPKSIKEIEDDYFNGCDSLERIDVEKGNRIYLSVDGVLFDKDRHKLMCYPKGKRDISFSFPSQVKLEDTPLIGNKYLKKIYIPKNTTIYTEYIKAPSLEQISVSKNHEKYKSVDGVLYSRDLGSLLCYPCGRKEEHYNILPQANEIYFSDECSFLKSIFIPANVNAIKRIPRCVERVELDENNRYYEFKDGKLFDRRTREIKWEGKRN